MSQGSLRDLLAGYDRDVDQTLREVLDAPSGTERVQLVYKLRRVVSVHDSVLGSALCPLLEDALRSLRLSGMLDTLEARLAQARAGELGHLEFLQCLCEDEVARRVIATP